MNTSMDPKRIQIIHHLLKARRLARVDEQVPDILLENATSEIIGHATAADALLYLPGGEDHMSAGGERWRQAQVAGTA